MLDYDRETHIEGVGENNRQFLENWERNMTVAEVKKVVLGYGWSIQAIV